MQISEEQKKKYLEKVHIEMKNRGFTDEKIPKVIGETGFMAALEKYPEEQIHYSAADAVNEIICTAARR